ncbi:hypothetical protein Tsubulata_000288 [Turnera subulata]|uniref:Uncharacterized protein n=1 Tax=Turnera subulata TaxID=218843 RepID=A0A9Q0F3G8_9ROSI|nr:hypothetical protein Tsubulata_000288 [Turnera subulata]
MWNDNDPESTIIRQLQELSLLSTEEQKSPYLAKQAYTPPPLDTRPPVVDQTQTSNDNSSLDFPLDGGSSSDQWVSLFVDEILMRATSMDDARTRVNRALKALEDSVREEAARSVAGEKAELKRKVENLWKIIDLLKRTVVSQRELRLKMEESVRESENLKRLVGEYQEKVRVLEMRNYALSVHLTQALPRTTQSNTSQS